MGTFLLGPCNLHVLEMLLTNILFGHSKGACYCFYTILLCTNHHKGIIQTMAHWCFIQMVPYERG